MTQDPEFPVVSPLPRGALIGSLIGFTAWASALGVLLATTADAATFWSWGPLLLFASIGLWALAVLATDGVRRRFGVRSRHVTLTLVGGILLVKGCLLTVVNGSVMPALEQHPKTLDILRATGTTTSVPPLLMAVLIIGGASLLAWVVWRSLRRI